MSQHITINGKIFEPSATIARQFSYSIDYVSKLAREGKVEATQVGRQWFVEAISFKNFVEDISVQKKIQREQLRKDRKIEFSSHSENSKIGNKKINTPKVDFLHSHTSPKSRRKYYDVTSAVFGTVLVMVAGVLSAAVINPSEFYNFYSSLDFGNFGNSLSVQKNADVTAGALGSWIDHSDTKHIPVHEDLTVPTAVPAVGVVVFDERKSTNELERVRASFSDEVEIYFEGEDTGVITPVFRDNKGEEYQFLMVPISDSNDGS